MVGWIGYFKLNLMKQPRMFKFLLSNRWYFVIWMMVVGAIVTPVVSVLIFQNTFEPKEITRSLIPSFLTGLILYSIYGKKKVQNNKRLLL